MPTNISSYRPHNAGHDYFAPGIYLITLVARHREDNYTLFGSFNDDLRQPAVVLNAIGKAVEECWQRIPAMQAQHGRCVAVHACCCMPDHFHGVLEVKQRMDVSVGEVIRGFKAGCTMAWHACCERPSMVAQEAASAPTTSLPSTSLPLASAPLTSQPLTSQPSISLPLTSSPPMVAQPYLDERNMLKRLSKRQRAAYYAAHPEAQQPLWDDNYDDTICLTDPTTGLYDERHRAAMLRYVADNPRRAIVRRLRPDFMRRALCLRLQVTGPDGRPVLTADGQPLFREYGAFGNFNLLRWARKVQVFCHRRARYGMLTDAERQTFGLRYTAYDDVETQVPYERTAHYLDECRRWKALLMAGQTVIVTPGISRGEHIIKDRCLESGYPLIHLQKEPIGRHWKPEAQRFDACAAGTLLILAPWQPDTLGDVCGVPSSTDFSIFHNLNTLAAEICRFSGKAQVTN